MHSSLRVKQSEIWISWKKWAIFGSLGPCSKKLQELNTRIFKERFPLNKDFKLRGYENIELYDSVNKEKNNHDYHTQIWISKSLKNDFKKEDLRCLKSESSNIIFTLILKIFFEKCWGFEGFLRIFAIFFLL